MHQPVKLEVELNLRPRPIINAKWEQRGGVLRKRVRPYDWSIARC